MGYSNVGIFNQKGIKMMNYSRDKTYKALPGDKIIVLLKNGVIIKGEVWRIGSKYIEIKIAPNIYPSNNKEMVFYKYSHEKVIIANIDRFAVFPGGLWTPIKDIDHRGRKHGKYRHY